MVNNDVVTWLESEQGQLSNFEIIEERDFVTGVTVGMRVRPGQRCLGSIINSTNS